MGNRERFTAKLKCPSCGAEGKARCEENANPLFSNNHLARNVLEASAGFEVGLRDEDGDQQVICSACKVPIPI